VLKSAQSSVSSKAIILVLEESWLTKPKKRTQVCSVGVLWKLKYGICDEMINLVTLSRQLNSYKGDRGLTEFALV